MEKSKALLNCRPETKSEIFRRSYFTNMCLAKWPIVKRCSGEGSGCCEWFTCSWQESHWRYHDDFWWLFSLKQGVNMGTDHSALLPHNYGTLSLQVLDHPLVWIVLKNLLNPSFQTCICWILLSHLCMLFLNFII